jgi:hypothetical protein
MNETLSADDRRHVRTSLITSLAFVFTFLLSGYAWAASTGPKAGGATSVKAAAAAPGTSGPAVEESEPGCGCAESCLVR